MHILGFVLAGMSSLAGLISACYWYQSSKIKASPAWEPDITGDPEKNQMAWVTGTMIALNKSGGLNKRAALWSALAVGGGAVSTALLSFFK